jgi:hypothetical protein
MYNLGNQEYSSIEQMKEMSKPLNDKGATADVIEVIDNDEDETKAKPILPDAPKIDQMLELESHVSQIQELKCQTKQ